MSQQLNSGNFKYISAFIEELLKYNPDDVDKKWDVNWDNIGEHLVSMVLVVSVLHSPSMYV
jgi:hypothetical protein